MNLIDESIWILKNGLNGESVLGAFSGGKDSIVIHKLCEIAGLDIEWHYHKTTIDPPELVHFIRNNYPEVVFDRPRHGNFFNRAKVKNILPSRHKRWCCDEYKESRGPLNTVWITGERREESASRANQPVIGLQRRTRRVIVRPISNWDSEYLWSFIRDENLNYPSLYDEGFKRLGCVGCPLASRSNREKEFDRWPKIREKWIAVARQVYETRAPWKKFYSFDEYFDAWMAGKI